MNAFPSVGEALSVASNEGDAQEVTAARARLAKLGLADMASTAAKSGAASFIAESSATVAHQKVTKVPVVIKCDVAGSMEAIVSALPDLQHRASDSGELGRADLVYAAVGEVTSFDVNVAAAAGATVLAFGVSSAPRTADEARSSGVEIRSYSVIYDLLNDLGKKIKETVAPHFSSGNVVGRMVVKKVFSLGKGGKVAGCAVSEGSVSLNCKVRILREGSNIPVFVGDVAGLKVGKDAVNEVSSGSDCGLSVLDFSLFEDGDVIECFVQSKK